MDEIGKLNAKYVTDRKICATGRLISMTHAELAKVVCACGGNYLRFPVRGSLELVVGVHGWPSENDGSLSRVFDRARRLKALGYAIEFTSEEEFLDRLGLSQSASAIRGRHTVGDLNRILGISSVRLRRWIRAGLIQPTTTQFQIPFFDFHQVAFVKQLHELLEDGASLSNIKQGIEQAKDLLPHGQSLSTQWSNIERDGRVLLRLRDQLIDHTGQKYLDFDDTDEVAPTLCVAANPHEFHDLCDEALALEEQGRPEAAADLYQRALQLEPEHPILHFDLGNVLFQLGRVDESIAQFRQAILYNSEFAMAWHNLGCVNAHLAAWDEAERCLRRALSLVPTYADSHFTLAEVLHQQGRPDEAAEHQTVYLEYNKANSLFATHNELLRVVHADA